MSTKKGFLPLIIGIIIALVAVGAGYYVIKKKPAVTWSTYENKDFAFSMKYPSTWTSLDVSQFKINGAVAALGSSGNAWGNKTRPIPANESAVVITPLTNTIDDLAQKTLATSDAIRTYNEQHNTTGTIDYKLISHDELNLNGHRAIKIVYTITQESPNSNAAFVSGYFVVYLFQNTNNNKESAYGIFLWTAVPLTPATENHAALFDEMMNTFTYSPTHI